MMLSHSRRVIGIVAKPQHKRALELTKELVAWLATRNEQYVLDRQIAGDLGFTDSASIVEREQMTKRCQVIVVLGGDGTLISASRHPVPNPPVIIGVNVGTLGFLTEITSDELIATTEAVLAGTAPLQMRPMLDVTVHRKGSDLAQFQVINDAVITKEALARLFDIELFVDSRFAAAVRGDGIIISTPGGSTAYSLSAGGSIVHPEVKALLVTPICPHSLTSRPLVLPDRSSIQLRVSAEVSTGGGEVYLTLDGQEGMELHGGDQMTITTSSRHVLFAKSTTRSYFEILATKLHWATSTVTQNR